ncbi:hypothetical protein DFH08DRAFT_1086818 [Mycena albidolilacea]|uniref:Uncharacterized protein n=1 Tax=Mycena albidolilacea TaxID=1033008 RepID=A0AAD7EEJ4_9AGAR|nr:hypothetical protein DFH08DRAFT_1086818 [Mycena albidolilacea]
MTVAAIAHFTLSFRSCDVEMLRLGKWVAFFNPYPHFLFTLALCGDGSDYHGSVCAIISAKFLVHIAASLSRRVAALTEHLVFEPPSCTCSAQMHNCVSHESRCVAWASHTVATQAARASGWETGRGDWTAIGGGGTRLSRVSSS